MTGHPDDHTTGHDQAAIECLGKAIMEAKIDSHRHDQVNSVVEMKGGRIAWARWWDAWVAYFNGHAVHIYCDVEPNGLTYWNKHPRRD